MISHAYTPGPWSAEDNHIVAGSVRVAVADTPSIHAGVDDAEAAANARLIAMAPELLGALMLLCNERIHTVGKWEEARRVIAAATGSAA